MMNDKTFLAKLPNKTHKRLKRMSMYTGYSMQEISAYAISKELDFFENKNPTIKALDLEQKDKYSIDINDIESKTEKNE